MATSFLQVIDLGLRLGLYTKFNDILNLPSVNQGVLLYPKEVAFRKLAEKKGEAITEFINLWREVTDVDWARQRTPVARRGMTLAYTDGNKTDITEAKAVPVKLEYNVWFWTKKIENINLLGERYLFWQQSNPNLSLLYNDVYPVELDLHFGALTDETNYIEMMSKGLHFSMRAPIVVDGWVFSSFSVKSITSIILTFYDKDDITNYEEIIVEDSDQDTELESTLKLFEKRIIFS